MPQLPPIPYQPCTEAPSSPRPHQHVLFSCLYDTVRWNVIVALSCTPLMSWFFFFILSSLSLQELQKYEQFIFADHTNMIHVENIYEEILYQILLDETLKGEEGALRNGVHSGNRTQEGRKVRMRKS